MAGIGIILVQQSAAQGAAQAAPAAPAQTPRDQLREQIRQITRDAQAAARDAQAAAQDARSTRVVIDGVPMVPPVPAIPGIPSVHVHDGFDASNVIPPQAVDIAIGFFVMCAVMVVGWPISRAFGRRLERRGEVMAVPAGLTDQLQRIEQAVEAMSIEVERISESQRFMAKLQNASSAGLALPHERG